MVRLKWMVWFHGVLCLSEVEDEDDEGDTEQAGSLSMLVTTALCSIPGVERMIDA